MSALPLPFSAPPDLFCIPYSIGCLGVSETLVFDLFLKHLFQAGTGTLSGLSRSLKLPVELVQGLFHQMKGQKLIEVKGMVGEDFQFILSLAGKAMAADRMQVSRYAGPVPVPLSTYEKAVRSQVTRTKVNR